MTSFIHDTRSWFRWVMQSTMAVCARRETAVSRRRIRAAIRRAD